MLRRLLLQLLFVWPILAYAQDFSIRGMLPWHNFLSGPSAWNEEDYRVYLDSMQAAGLNLVVFHNYTGGAQRYHTYVEPMIRVRARDILPEATFGTSVTPWWGYRPLPVSRFAFGTGSLYDLPEGADAFGSDAMLTARTNEERYANAQALMRRVMEMAHERGIRFAMGFEFGVHPPEYASILPQKSILESNGVVLKPDSPEAAELVQSIVDDILQAYPGIDQIWLWLQEHSFFVETGPSWAEQYIRLAYDAIRERTPGVTVVLSGWGGSGQLPDLLRQLDTTLPRDIVFAPLNPMQGDEPHVPVLAEIARHRTVWAIPWLEGDARLWHLQPRVTKMLHSVDRAYRDSLDGVVALHWRTEDVRQNFEAYALAASGPDRIPTVEQFYSVWARQEYGMAAGSALAPMLARLDRSGLLSAAESHEYYPYDPFTWGVLNPETRRQIEDALRQVESTRPDAAHRENVDWLAENLRFFLLFDEVSRNMQPAYRLRDDWLTGKIRGDSLKTAAAEARRALDAAPMQALFEGYARRVRSRGELGVLSSLNQRLWLQWQELDAFLRRH